MAPSHIIRCCQRSLSWIPVVFIVLVVCWSYYAYVVELCVYTIPKTEEQIVYLTGFHLFFFMFVWSYWMTIFTKPANPSKEFSLSKVDKEQYETAERPEIQQEILRRAARELPIYTRTAIRYCDRCQVIKPDRLTSLSFFCPLFAPCFDPSVIPPSSCHSLSPQSELPDTQAKFHVLFLFFVSAMFFISILSLFCYHMWLVGKNRSTIEAFRAPVFRNGPDKNGFSLGLSKNIAQVFGDQKRSWMLPFYSSLGDGHIFPTRLVSYDPEQLPADLQACSDSDGQAYPRPLSESQNHLLSNDVHFVDDVPSTGELSRHRHVSCLPRSE
uniref:Zinc finger DHHC-type containing 20b n=1 Tax=Paramormyrops kingsleyae TaxID=1676925 RepID=A0A3B3Q4D4_9TELE